MTHTTGPWKAVAGLSRWNVTTSNGPRTFNICAVSTDRMEQAENARLLAAAPDLLAALQAFLRAPSIGSSGPGSVTIEVQTFNLNAARAAIARATE